MKFYEASIKSIFWRYLFIAYFSMFVFLIGKPFLFLLIIPIFISALMGIKFDWSWIRALKKEKIVIEKEITPPIYVYESISSVVILTE